MSKAPTLQTRIIAKLSRGELTDRQLFACFPKLPQGSVARELLALRNAGRVVATHAGTVLRLAP